MTTETKLTKEQRLALFTDELNLIQNESIRNFTEDMLGKLPDYFFEIQASSTGKYHPTFAQGPHGLVRHTICAINIAHDLVTRNDMFASCKPYVNHIISALMLHDGCKSGRIKQQYTQHDHPIQVCNLIKEHYQDKNSELICSLISSHMGQWSTGRGSSVVLPKPQNVLQSVVHLADYLASRRYLDFNFEKKGG